MSKRQEQFNEQIDALTDLVTSEGWGFIKQLDAEHLAHLQDECNRCIDNGQIDKAKEIRGRMKECERQIGLPKSMIDQLRQELVQEENHGSIK